MMCDVNHKRLNHLRQVYPEIEAVTDFKTVIEDPSVSAVVVATPAKSHYSMVKASLLAGKHVLVEKPMAVSSLDCEELVEIAEERGLTLMVGLTCLYSPVIRKIKEIVESGELGEIRYISARRLGLGLFQADLNVAWDLALHDISIILYLLGQRPLRLNCSGGSHLNPRVEDVSSMWLTFRDDCSAIVTSSWLDPRKVREITIVGSKRTIVFDDVASNQKMKIFDARVETPPYYDTFAEFHFSYHYGDMVAPYIQQVEPLKVEAEHFLECIREGSKPLTGGQEGLELVRILEAATVSLKQGGASIELDGGAVKPKSFSKRLVSQEKSGGKLKRPSENEPISMIWKTFSRRGGVD